MALDGERREGREKEYSINATLPSLARELKEASNEENGKYMLKIEQTAA